MKPTYFTVPDAGHTYELENVEGGMQTLQFIRKEEKDGKLETMINGTTNEAVIAVLIDRLEYLHAKLPDTYTEEAIAALRAAFDNLNKRTADRKAREVEGTSAA